jgi:hypothetical protein
MGVRRDDVLESREGVKFWWTRVTSCDEIVYKKLCEEIHLAFDRMNRNQFNEACSRGSYINRSLRFYLRNVF